MLTLRLDVHVNKDEIGIKVALKYEHFPEIHTSYNFQIAEITLNKDIKKI